MQRRQAYRADARSAEFKMSWLTSQKLSCDTSGMALLSQIPYHWRSSNHELDSKRDALMIDNPAKTARLVAALKAAVPFEVELAP